MSEGALATRATPRPRLGTLAVVAIAIAALVWLGARWNQGEQPRPRAPQAANASPNAALASTRRLQAVAAVAGHPIHWARQLPGRRFELSRTNVGVFIRYLPRDARPGDPRSTFLTIGTYPLANAYATVKQLALEPGARVDRLPNGGLAVTRRSRPTSVYLSYPRSPVQVEVYDPAPGSARRLVTSGRIHPIRP